MGRNWTKSSRSRAMRRSRSAACPPAASSSMIISSAASSAQLSASMGTGACKTAMERRTQRMARGYSSTSSLKYTMAWFSRQVKHCSARLSSNQVPSSPPRPAHNDSLREKELAHVAKRDQEIGKREERDWNITYFRKIMILSKKS